MINRTPPGGHRRAMTLIELLIVIAIIAIMSTGLIAWMTVPPKERILATADRENEQGLATFFAKLVSDAHNAAGLKVAPSGRALILEAVGEDASAVYIVDQKNNLRRSLMSRERAARWMQEPNPEKDQEKETVAAAWLVGNVRRFEAAPLSGGSMWRISVSIASRDPLHPTLDRAIELAIGNPEPLTAGSSASVLPLPHPQILGEDGEKGEKE